MIKNKYKFKVLASIILVPILWLSFVLEALSIDFQKYLFINQIKGNAYLDRSLIKDNIYIREGGHIIETSSNSSLNINVDSVSDSIYQILLKENSRIRVNNNVDDNYAGSLIVESGQVRIRANRPVDIRTPSSITSVRGTEVNIVVNPEGNTIIYVQEGKVENFTLDGLFINTLERGEGAIINQSNTLNANRFSFRDYTRALRVYSINYIIREEDILISITGYLREGFFIKTNLGFIVFRNPNNGTINLEIRYDQLDSTYVLSADNAFKRSIKDILLE